MKRQITALFLVIVMIVVLPVLVLAAAAPPGTANNKIMDSRVAFSDSGVYALLTGKLYYYDYAADTAIFLRDVDLVDDHYRMKLNGTPLDFQRSYELTDSNGFIQWYDDALWLVTQTQIAADPAPHYVLRKYDQFAENAADWALGMGDNAGIGNGSLHHGRFFYLSHEQVKLPDGNFTGYRYLCELNLADGTNRRLNIPLALESFTLADGSLYFEASAPPDPLTYPTMADIQAGNFSFELNSYGLYRYDIDTEVLTDLNADSAGYYVLPFGDRLLYSVQEKPPSDDSGDDESDRPSYDMTTHVFDLDGSEPTGKSTVYGQLGVTIVDGTRLVDSSLSYGDDMSMTVEIRVYDNDDTLIYSYEDTYEPGTDFDKLPTLAGVDRGRIFLLKGIYRDYNVDHRQLIMIDTNEDNPEPRVVIEWEK